MLDYEKFDWKSKKHNVVTQSSAGAELRAITQGIYYLLLMKINIVHL